MSNISNPLLVSLRPVNLETAPPAADPEDLAMDLSPFCGRRDVHAPLSGRVEVLSHIDEKIAVVLERLEGVLRIVRTGGTLDCSAISGGDYVAGEVMHALVVLSRSENTKQGLAWSESLLSGLRANNEISDRDLLRFISINYPSVLEVPLVPGQARDPLAVLLEEGILFEANGKADVSNVPRVSELEDHVRDEVILSALYNLMGSAPELVIGAVDACRQDPRFTNFLIGKLLRVVYEPHEYGAAAHPGQFVSEPVADSYAAIPRVQQVAREFIPRATEIARYRSI